MTNAKEMVDHLAKFAEHTFHTEGEVLPMWVLEEADGAKTPILAPFNGDEEKDIAVSFVREKAKEISAVVSGFVCEAWVVESLKDKGDLKCQPSKHQDRREIIHIYGEDKQGGSVMALYYILRPEIGKPKLSPLKIMDGDATGRFTSILEKA